MVRLNVCLELKDKLTSNNRFPSSDLLTFFLFVDFFFKYKIS